MNTLTGIFVTLAALGAALTYQASPKPATSKIGKRPASVEKKMDISQAKLKNGHDLAMFGAG